MIPLLPPPPWTEFTICARCGEPVLTSESVVVINADQYAGQAHKNCEED